MDEISKSVIQNIKTGHYYKDARRWYAHKYLYPVVERSFLIVISSVTTIAFLFVIYNFNALFPLRAEVPFVVKVEDSLDYYSVLKPLSKESETSQEVITKYLLGEYVQEYESFSYKDITRHDKRIKASSSKQVYKTFTNTMSTDNPESPLLLYQKTTIRTTKILSVKFLEADENASNAEIVFEATLDDRLKKTKTTAKYEAILTFTISNVADVISKKEPLEFIVTDYQTRQIK